MPDQLRETLINRLRQLVDEPSPTQKIMLPKVEAMNLEGAGPTIIPHPPQWQPAPNVMGGHKLARVVDQLFSFAPALQGQILGVQNGPTDRVLNMIANDGAKNAKHFKGHEFEDTNLLGLTDLLSRRVALNPRLQDDEDMENRVAAMGGKIGWEHHSPLEILAHEATHVSSGTHGEELPWEAAEIVNKLKQNLR